MFFTISLCYNYTLLVICCIKCDDVCEGDVILLLKNQSVRTNSIFMFYFFIKIKKKKIMSSDVPFYCPSYCI